MAEQEKNGNAREDGYCQVPVEEEDPAKALKSADVETTTGMEDKAGKEDKVGKVAAVEGSPKLFEQVEPPANASARAVTLDEDKEGTITKDDLEEEDEAMEFDIDEDAYGAAMLAITKDLPKVLAGKDPHRFHLLQVLFSVALIIVNFFMQTGMVYLIAERVVGPKVHKVQGHYKRFHEQVFDHEGNLVPDQWNDFPEKLQICQVGPSDWWFYRATLLVWVFTMCTEFRSCVELAGNIAAMPTCVEMKDMIKTKVTVDGEKSQFITALTDRIRKAMYAFIILPKMIICVVLLGQGLRWLTATTRFEDLVMNAVAMDFVLRVDEYLYQAFLPNARKDDVADINFELPRDPGEDEEARARKALMKGYRQSMCYFFGSCFIVWAYATYSQTVLPPNLDDVKMACANLDVLHPTMCESPDLWPTLVRAWARVQGHQPEMACYPFGSTDTNGRLEEL